MTSTVSSRRPLHALAVALLLTCCAAAHAAPAARVDAPAAKMLTFAKDATHAVAKGTLKAPKTIQFDHTIELKAGESAAVTLVAKNAGTTFFNLLSPVAPGAAPPPAGEGQTRSTIHARTDGTYTIRVFLTRDAVTKGVSTTYTLDVTRT